jgi:ADP-heptose:LPS heptosyltransferase
LKTHILFLVSFIKLDYWLRNSILKIFERIFFSHNKLFDAQKILIFRTGSLGDSICALPAINIVRKNFPNAKIDVLTNSGSENLVSLKHLIKKSIVNNIIDYLGIPQKQLSVMLKQANYELFIEFPQSHQTLLRLLRNILWVRIIGIKKAFGWEIAATRLFPAIQDKHILFKNERDRLVDILKLKGFNIFSYEYPLNINDNTVRKVKELLDHSSINEKEKNVAFVIGAKRQQNRWPIQYFNEVKEYLVSNGLNILLIGDKYDFEITKNFTGRNIYNYCDQLEPLETAELLKNCKFTISNDTGPMHLSYAVGTPVIAIFSSRDYKRKWYPPEGKNFVLRNENIYCTDCFMNVCTGEKCLVKIKPENVINLIKTSLLPLKNIPTY